MKNISKFILFRLMGWKIVNDFPRNIKKYIIIVAPHTSWVDFPLSILVEFITKVDIKFIGKHTLFKPPFGFLFKALGGTPVDRSKSQSMVQAIIDIFNSKDEFIMALSPEGTRKKASQWKSGFYHVAKGANIPLVMAALDFKNKKVIISEPYYLSENEEQDIQKIKTFFKGVQGKHPENFDPDFTLKL
jgi:1-acyl-sn-glycerol-3-phosphate acyltransferase